MTRKFCKSVMESRLAGQICCVVTRLITNQLIEALVTMGTQDAPWRVNTYGLNWAALVCPLLLPVSFLWDLVSYWSLLASYWLARGATTHEDKVQDVQEQVIIFSVNIFGVYV